MGCKRGECFDSGCDGFVFNAPGQQKGVWGWNDTTALCCKRCGEPADAALLEEEEVTVKDLSEIMQRGGRAAVETVLKQVGITKIDHRLRVADAALLAL